MMPNLLLQKPYKNSKSKDHQLALESRLKLWHKGEFKELYFKGETIQASLKTIQKTSSMVEISKKFNSAIKLTDIQYGNGVLPINKNTLLQKHPKGKTPSQDILLNSILQDIHPVKSQ